MEFTVLVADSEIPFFESACKTLQAEITNRALEEPGLTWVTLKGITASGLITIGQHITVEQIKSRKAA